MRSRLGTGMSFNPSAEISIPQISGNDPPVEPEAFRLLAPQRGLIATEQKQTPCTTLWECSWSPARTPGKAYCRKCQTATASPAEPGGLSYWTSTAANGVGRMSHETQLWGACSGAASIWCPVHRA